MLLLAQLLLASVNFLLMAYNISTGSMGTACISALAGGFILGIATSTFMHNKF